MKRLQGSQQLFSQHSLEVIMLFSQHSLEVMLLFSQHSLEVILLYATNRHQAERSYILAACENMKSVQLAGTNIHMQSNMHRQLMTVNLTAWGWVWTQHDLQQRVVRGHMRTAER